MFRYIFASMFVAAAWGVVVYFELPYWIAGAVTGVISLTIGLIFSIKFARSRRASREIERALKAQAEQQARSARPDLEADIRSLQEEFTRAINALKGSRLGARGAASALYSLPWYVIVGPPGVGKSTALRNSGLKFPFSSSRGGVSVQGVGGTRNCEWWMTSEAVILDTAGRYTTEGGDREEWFAFLDLLRKYRTRRPLNGVIAAVSVADIAEAHPEEVAGLAREVRARIDELQGRLGVVVPVYVLFTKCDLLPGFVEMFADLTEQERHQIWGFTLKVGDQLALADQCAQYFDGLTALLEKRALRRMAEERSLARRDRIHEHPQYIGALREPIARFVHELTEPNIYHETPILRGVYLTSGTQEGRPLSRIMNSISEAFGLRPTMGGVTAAPVDAKSYFLGEIFRKVIFPDYQLVRHNRVRTRKSRVVGVVAGVVALVTAAAVVWLPMVSFGHNRDLLGQAGTSLAYIEQHIEQDTVDVIPMDRIEPLRQLVEVLDGYEDDGAPWSMRMGMYQGARIFPRVRDVFADTVRRELLVPTSERELVELDNFIRQYSLNNKSPTMEEYEVNFDRLRMYLLTTGPSGPGEPGLDEAETAWLVARLAKLWEAPIAVTDDTTARASIEKVAATYVQMLAARPELAFERDTTTVERARDILERADRTKAVANALIASVTGPALTLKKMVSVSSIKNDDQIIRPAFTRRGFERQIQPVFEKGLEAFLDPQWVLAPGNEAATQLLGEEIAAIQTEYYRQYIAEWRTFIDRLYLHVPKGSDSTDTLALLEDLTRTEPYRDLFTQIAWHTTLADPNAETDGIAGAVGESRLAREAKRTAENAGNRVAGSALAKTGLSRVGMGIGIVRAGFDAAMEQRAVADPNTAELVTPYTVTLVFAPLAAFGANVATPPPEDGSPPPPAEVKPLDEYLEQLKYVREGLQSRLDDPNEKEQLVDRLKKARARVKSILASEKNNTWAPVLEKLLMPPLSIASSGAEGDIIGERSNKWCNEVVASYERTLARGYPFNPSGSDVAMADFTDFFHPEEGEVWKYYESVLKGGVIERGKVFELAEAGPSGSPYKENVVAFLNATTEVSSSMFARGSKDPQVSFKVMLQGSRDIKEVSLTVDGEVVKYRNGPLSWGTLSWPGEGSDRGARIEVQGFSSKDELEEPGEWGLLRLLERGKVKKVDKDRIFVAQWDFTDEGLGLVQIKFQPDRIDTPFYGLGGRKPFMSIFRTSKLVAPRSIMKKAPLCKPGRE